MVPDVDRRGIGVMPHGALSPRSRVTDGPQAGRRRSDLVAAALIAALPHELRRSLGVISLLADGLGESGEAGRQIALEVRRLDRLIDAMTQITRVAAGPEAVAVEALAAARIVADADAAFARDPDRCAVVLEQDDDLPMVRGNAVLIEMILVNLLSNASRHGDPPVVLEARRSGSMVRFAARDAGAGFDPGRVHAGTSSMAGRIPGAMGVGLTICRSFAAEIGGWLDVESGADGTRVGLCLPVARPR